MICPTMFHHSLARFVPTGEITIHEMQEFLYQHGYELKPPDDETTFTAKDYWTCVIKVARDRLTNPDRVIKMDWKQEESGS